MSWSKVNDESLSKTRAFHSPVCIWERRGSAWRGPGADPAHLGLTMVLADRLHMSSGASGEPGCHSVSRGPGGVLFFLMWLSHTPGSAVPHNYTECTSLKMLISPLTHFGLRATVPTSPGSGAQPMTHRPPPFSSEIASQVEVNRASVNLGIALEDPSPLLGLKAPSAPRLHTHSMLLHLCPHPHGATPPSGSPTAQACSLSFRRPAPPAQLARLGRDQ